MGKKSAALAFIAVTWCGAALAQQPASTQQQPSTAATAKKPATGGTATKSTTGSQTKTPGAASSTVKSGATALTTKKQKQSYAIGANFGLGLKQQPIDVDPAIVAQGVKDALSGGKLAMTNEEAGAVLKELQADLQKKQETMMSQMSDTNKKEGATFLAANKAKEGVVTTSSGLQYKIVKQGTGPKPTASDTVVCNYRGTLINGKEFDSSYKRGQPASFPVSGVIRGWTEALQLMPVGSKWELYVPSDLAYGDRGAGPDIGPGSTLIFEVELLSIQGKH
ncbi:MAG TPA: FKBP-type peptidyl-prolyl cis-trans isomerase [Candidatus Acidoferrales bacterium]|jgi:FKBP-type peptidyl-prolyl cis-trans isomerase|nr:FKBP-type peptidyl-prolyl cis-trans isomerase [Candidatus Acidoferrales bacterium]